MLGTGRSCADTDAHGASGYRQTHTPHTAKQRLNWLRNEQGNPLQDRLGGQHLLQPSSMHQGVPMLFFFFPPSSPAGCRAQCCQHWHHFSTSHSRRAPCLDAATSLGLCRARPQSQGTGHSPGQGHTHARHHALRQGKAVEWVSPPLKRQIPPSSQWRCSCLSGCGGITMLHPEWF